MSGQQPDKFFCVLCQDTGRLCYDNKKDLEDHFRDIHFNDSPSEEIFAIDLWVDRHIKYQESLNKVMTQGIKTIPDRNKMVYKGCPMCDAIIEVCLDQWWTSCKILDRRGVWHKGIHT